jgi:lipopolysaccharide export system permease protein
MAFATVLFLMVMQNFFLYLDDIMGKGLPWYIIAQFLIYSSATIVPIVIPLAVLLGSIMTFGNLAENFELTAMKSSGISLLKIMRPMIFLIILTAAGEFIFLNNVWPVANLKLRSLIWDITRKKPTLNLKNDAFYNGLNGVSIRVRKNDTENNRLEDVLIYFHSEDEPGNNRVIRANWGTMMQSSDDRNMILTLYDGYEYQDSQYKRLAKKSDNTFELLRSDFEKIVLRIDLSNFDFNKTDEELFSQYYEMLNISQIQFMQDSLETRFVSRSNEYNNYINKFIYIRNPLKSKDSINVRTDSTAIGIAAAAAVIPLPLNEELPDSSFYVYLENSNQLRTIEAAKNLVRNDRNYIMRSKEEFETRQRYIDRYKIEWHRKIMLSIACIVLFFVGAPLGAIIRKGGFGFPVVFSIVFFLIFHISSTAGEKMVKTGISSPLIGMWLGIMVLLPFAIFLTYKAINDSSVLDKDFYKQLLLPVTRLFSKKKKVDESTSTLS